MFFLEIFPYLDELQRHNQLSVPREGVGIEVCPILLKLKHINPHKQSAEHGKLQNEDWNINKSKSEKAI
jgi:hypothetical protein